MKKKNLATAMAAAMAFGGVAPVVAHANEPVVRSVVNDGGTVDVALAEGKKVTTGAAYTDVYNLNGTTETSDDELKAGLEILYWDGKVGETATAAETTAKYLVAQKYTDAELDATTTGKTIREVVEQEIANLEDTKDYISQLLNLTFNKDGQKVKIYKMTQKETKSSAGTNVAVTLTRVDGAPQEHDKEKTFNFKNIKLEQTNVLPEIGKNTIDVTTDSGIIELNKLVYKLNTAPYKGNIVADKTETLEGANITLNVVIKEKSTDREIATLTINKFDEFKKSGFKGFVDVTSLQGFDELDFAEISYAKGFMVDAILEGKLTGDERGIRAKDNITRAEFAKMLVELKGNGINEEATESFTDVDKTDWFYGYVATLVRDGIVSGDGDGTFRPNDYITRQEAAVMIAAQMNDNKKVDAHKRDNGDAIDSKTKFKDDASIKLWADGAVKVINEAGLSNGDENGNFNPENNIIRAEAITMLSRTINGNNDVTPENELTGAEASYK